MEINKNTTIILQGKRIYLCLAFLVSLFMVTLHGCGDEKIPETEKTEFRITGISLPTSLEIRKNGEITLTGKGFEVGDLINFVVFNDENSKFSTKVLSVTSQSALFKLPVNLSSGTYSLSVTRDSQTLTLGTIQIIIIADNDIPDNAIPDIQGMTVKGVVYCDDEGIPGVVVSDGYEVTITDENGIYYLPSDKQSGYIFISVPGNYEVPNNKNLPQFYQRLAGGSKVEQIDFSLIKVDNSNHVVLAMADWHLANRTNDLEQFTSGFLVDVNNIIRDYQSKGVKVYGLTLGDMSWDRYWYDNSFALPEYLTMMNKINCPIFNVMGNHDNDPYISGDWASEQTFKDIVGPTYYAFNLGKIHYIVLDNIEYINLGGAQGVVGQRNYNKTIVQRQRVWLKRHLATIEDKDTPIVIGMHAPLHGRVKVDNNGSYQPKITMENGDLLVSDLSGFSNVHLLTGHSHINYAVNASSTLMEHNIGAVCATWWWTGSNGYAGNHICKDGSPGGYSVWELNNREIEWYYKSIGYDRTYQFRAYDLNTVHITAATHAPNSSDVLLAPYAKEYATPGNLNEVLINVFGYDDEWEVEVKENENMLEVKRVKTHDPLHIISYTALRLNDGAEPNFATHNTSHMFKAKAASATSSLQITVKDRFGNIYSEIMERPKAFTYSMK
ncbi:Metallophosphoesterase{ECO:0000313/EMBL:KJD3697 2,1} [Petrimonas mucosa]|uniref:Metallophosphoesterase n=2 Tax=Petrimonas mucosa TaxID=1642646 RepID=A0A1G4G6B4_9BACT|nr:Metallophosphoesterase{ECO:0000313/EMBL:KJD3697 2,1} [Petrimonas mucosa]